MQLHTVDVRQSLYAHVVQIPYIYMAALALLLIVSSLADASCFWGVAVAVEPPSE